MRTPRFWFMALLFIGWIMHVAAWFLPTCQDRPGYFAFLGSLAPLAWPFYPPSGEKVTLFMLLGSGIFGLSALSNILVLVSFLTIGLESRRLRVVLGRLCCAAFLYNALWILLFAVSVYSRVKELQIGYYLWWVSFAIVGVGLFGFRVGNEDSGT